MSFSSPAKASVVDHGDDPLRHRAKPVDERRASREND